jgi:hypothetical protein
MKNAFMRRRKLALWWGNPLKLDDEFVLEKKMPLLCNHTLIRTAGHILIPGNYHIKQTIKHSV